MSTAIHLCTAEDMPRLAPLLSAFREEFGLTQDDAARERAVRPLLEGSPYGACYLLGPTRAPVGYVIVTFGWSVELGGMDSWIDEIFIRPPVRGRGIALEALNAVSRSLARAGINAIHLEADRQTPEAHRLYIRAGFELRERYCLMTQSL